MRAKTTGTEFTGEAAVPRIERRRPRLPFFLSRRGLRFDLSLRNAARVEGLRVRIGRREVWISRIGEGPTARFLADIPTGSGWKIARIEAVSGDHVVPLKTFLFLRLPGPSPDGASYYPAHRDLPTPPEQERLRRRVEAVREPPSFSVLVPVYNPEPEFLREAVGSVREQVYPRWELILADDASDRPGVSEVLDSLAREDDRIRVLRSESNGHISRTSNRAAAAAVHPWLALLDHDDLLAPGALAEFVLALEQTPDALLLYGDEDKLDRHGSRRNPYFKPGWNRQLLESQNYICHPAVFRADRFRHVGGFREGFEGSQDWDLFLRLTGAFCPEAVRRVPRVLYHWREHEGSTAGSVEAKPYTIEAARRAVSEARERRGLSGAVSLVRGMYWEPSEPDEGASVNWDGADGCERSTAGWIAVGGASVSRDRRHWLSRRLARFADDPSIGVVGVRSDGPEGIRHCGIAAHPGAGLLRLFAGMNPLQPGMGSRAVLPQDIGAVAGGIFFLRAEWWSEFRELRGQFTSMDAAAVALCRSVWRSGSRVLLDAATVVTVPGAPPGALPVEDLTILRKIDPAWFADDPAFHPFLEPVSGPLKPIRF